ncbi:MAG TPA: TetR family transcriptional regulator [Mycobacteriales bacterium]|jgi:TetR/AcrR family acrAB operon transcriptional repressor
MRRTSADAARTRAAILRTALTVFARRGFAAATLAEIGAAAGLTRGAVYHHFSDKADLYLAAVTEGWTGVLDRLGPDLAGPADPADVLTGFVAAFYTALHDDPAFGELLTVTVAGLDAPAPATAGYDIKAKALSGLLRQLTDLCERLADAGRLPAGVTPLSAARVVLASLSGAVLLRALDPGLVFDGPSGVVELTAATLRGVLAHPT